LLGKKRRRRKKEEKKRGNNKKEKGKTFEQFCSGVLIVLVQ